MRENFTIKGKDNKEVTLMDYFLNEDNNLEFANSDMFSYSGVRYVFNSQNGTLDILGLDKDISIKLSKMDINAFAKVESEIKKSLNKLYKDILENKEKLICFPTPLEEYPLHITTETIINEGLTSPKYVKALVFALSDSQLKKAGYKEQPGFADYADTQKRLGTHIAAKGLPLVEYINSEAYILTLKDAIEGI